MTATVDGPAWAQQGLDMRAGRYPLSVEAPVLAMTATLMPGLSTQTQFARYYGLYWALAAHAERADLDADTCRRMVRRSELLLAYVTYRQDGPEAIAHGADAMRRGLDDEREFWPLAETGKGSYSARTWGFWGQYGGPSEALGTVTTDARALRPARHLCPVAVQEFYAPLLRGAEDSTDPDPDDLLPELEPYAVGAFAGPDLDALGELFAASAGDPDERTNEDQSRRASLRILACAGALHPGASRLVAMRDAVAYGDACENDPVLIAEADRAAAWRGLLLRHRSVGAWRLLWSRLVHHIHREERLVTRDDLRAWAADQLPDTPLSIFLDGLPPVVDAAGRPLDAETAVEQEERGSVEQDIAVLLSGARRVDTMEPKARVAFLGNPRAFPGPMWIADQVAEFAARSVRDLAAALVDDMLAQSRRVALRKMEITGDRMRVFSRVHERNGVYTADSLEGAGNVGLRIDELARLAGQVGLLDEHGLVTDRGEQLLRVRR